MQYRAIKGMNDILPDEIGRWQRFEGAFRRAFELADYREVRTPLVEQTALFVRSVGEATDIVQKEMYSFTHHDEGLTLRPEGTAGAARAYVEHGVHSKEPVTRWYYLGPMYRAERPQRGRYREFYQAGGEIYGDAGPASDAEMIDLLQRFFVSLGLRDVKVLVNSLGGPGTRDRYLATLREFLRPRAADLSEHARSRIDGNALRILDSKDPRDKAVVAGAPSILDSLDDGDRAHFDGLRRALDALGTPYVVEPALVRGFDYYTRTLFELQTSAGELGAQNAVGGGGRYDGMIESLGGPSTPAIGFSLGIERILLAMGPSAEPPRPICALLPLGEAATIQALVLAREIREAGIAAEVDTRGTSMKSMLRRANAIGARWAVLLGEAEIEKGVVQIKDLAAHTQAESPRAEAALAIQRAASGSAA